MKKIPHLSRLFLAFWIVTGATNTGFATKPLKIVSPDRAVRFGLQIRGDGLHYEVFFKDKPVIETSPLRIMVDGIDLTADLEIGRVKRFAVKETYPWRGVHSRASNY